MRLQALAAPLVLLALGTATAPAQQFEGIVTMKTVNLTSDIVAEHTGEEELSDRGREKLFAMTIEQLMQIAGSNNVSVMQVKGGRMRTAPMEMPGVGSAYMLLDAAQGLMRTVAPARRGYYEVSLRNLATSSPDEIEEMQITPLGKTQTINGLRCTGYRVTQGDVLSHVWTTEDPALRSMVTNQLRL